MKQFVCDLLHGAVIAAAVTLVYGAVVALGIAIVGYETGVLGW